MRRLARAALTGMTLATGGATAATLTLNPFAQPLVERGTGEVRVALERAMAREVTAAWLAPRIEAALAEGDRDRLEMLASLANRYGAGLAPEMWARIDAALAPPPLAERASDCAACAVEIESCATLSELAACALPFEMTVAGDVNALRRQAQVALGGGEVDRLEAGLALVGIGATLAVLATGGASYVLKAGATSLRLARRMGALTPGFGRVLGEAADLPVDWRAVLRGGTLAEITDIPKLERLARIAGDVGTIRTNTSAAEALVLLRHVESAEDAARLARLSAAAGPETRATMEVLGKTRAFRALTRVSESFLAALALVTVLAAQLGMLALSLAGRRLFRPVARRGKPGHDRRH